MGSLLIEEFLRSTDCVIYALVRGKTKSSARTRLFEMLEKVIETRMPHEVLEERVKICLGDVSEPGLGMDDKTLARLKDADISTIYHSAAITDLMAPITRLRKTNTLGAKNVLDLALDLRQFGVLKKINHISTAYVAGDKCCVFKESDLDVGQDFYNAYEKTKYEAELLVHEYRDKGLDIDVFRPSIILGSYKDGKTTNFKMFYQPLHFFSLMLYDRIPASPDAVPNIINIDTVAKAIYLISRNPARKNRTYHIISPKTVTLKYVFDIAEEYFGYPMPELVPGEELDMNAEYTPVLKRLIKPFIPYFNYFTEFDMKNTLEALDGTGFQFPEFDEENLLRIYDFCYRCGFIKRKTSNVITK